MRAAVADLRKRLGPTLRLALCAPLAALSLVGCNSGFVYERLDWVVSWYVGGFVTLDDGQEARLDALLDDTIDWHRRTQLPRYVRFLDELAAESGQPLDTERVARRYREVEAMLDDLVRQTNPGAAALLATLRPAQIEELAANLEEDNEELWDELAGATPERRAERRLRSANKALQRFYGRLTPAQKALVEVRLQQLADVSDHWIERRRHWQERFLSALAAPPAGGLEPFLLDLMLNPNQFDTADYRREVEANRKVVFAMIAELSGTLTPEQRRHVQRKLAGWSADLREMAGPG